jgi:hypothetical protein
LKKTKEDFGDFFKKNTKNQKNCMIAQKSARNFVNSVYFCTKTVPGMENENSGKFQKRLTFLHICDTINEATKYLQGHCARS